MNKNEETYNSKHDKKMVQNYYQRHRNADALGRNQIQYEYVMNPAGHIQKVVDKEMPGKAHAARDCLLTNGLSAHDTILRSCSRPVSEDKLAQKDCNLVASQSQQGFSEGLKECCRQYFPTRLFIIKINCRRCLHAKLSKLQ